MLSTRLLVGQANLATKNLDGIPKFRRPVLEPEISESLHKSPFIPCFKKSAKVVEQPQVFAPRGSVQTPAPPTLFFYPQVAQILLFGHLRLTQASSGLLR